MFNGKLRIWDINNIVTAGELYGDELFAATVSSTDSYGEFVNWICYRSRALVFVTSSQFSNSF